MSDNRFIGVRCPCGKPSRYSHMVDDGEVLSCNKYAVCLSYDELGDKVYSLQAEVERLTAGIKEHQDRKLLKRDTFDGIVGIFDCELWALLENTQ